MTPLIYPDDEHVTGSHCWEDFGSRTSVASVTRDNVLMEENCLVRAVHLSVWGIVL